VANQSIIGTGAIAYYNMAVEAEYLKLYRDAKKGYEMALKLSNKLQGSKELGLKVMKALYFMNIKVRNRVQRK